MKIYRIGMYENPTVDELVAMRTVPFAHFSAVGTWSKGKTCAECGNHNFRYIAPLLIEWEVSTDAIGDFSWDGPFGYCFIVQRCVKDAFPSLGFECRFASTKSVPPSTKRKTMRVPFPYKGPRLWWCSCNTFVELDHSKSDVKLTVQCDSCGVSRYTFKMDGIVIRRNQLAGAQMFRVVSNNPSMATFVTEDGKRAIQSMKFTNISFSEAGRVIG